MQHGHRFNSVFFNFNTSISIVMVVAEPLWLIGDTAFHLAEFEDNRLLLYILVCKAWFCWSYWCWREHLLQSIYGIMSWPQTLFSQFEFDPPPRTQEQMLAIKTAGETGGKRAGSHILVEEQYFVQSDLWSGRNQRVANHQCKWLLQQSQGWSLAYIRFFDCPLWKEMRTLTSPGI